MEIERTKGTILIDDEDAGVLDGWMIEIKMHSPNHPYVHLRKSKTKYRKCIRKSLARVLMGEPEGLDVDHINHNTFDNRRCNLRVCTKSENCRNNVGQRTRKGSKYKGVMFQNPAKYQPGYNNVKVWRAYTRVKGKRLWFGYFATEEDAARAYNENAKRLFGEFACLNAV